ncbi:restriction modification system DNA specificity subunit [Pseudoscardovia radai]|uniref:Restriction modification system DNA specificity subunit n=2 Tax=Pseudoscardovia radai TaxID=987066 RepID=A0A261ERA2_9BIFI|nr:restriction modification system DNA specificity subunit [Pseudoscardovia radai]
MRYASRESSNSTDDYMRTYNVMRVGDIAFEGHTSNEFAFGRFVENDLGDGIVSHVFVVLRPLPGRRYDLAFWKEAIHDEFLMKRILARSTKRSTMMHEIVVSDFLKEVFAVPSLSEQQKIGRFFSTLDSLIAAAERQEGLLKQKKQAYLQLMFPQEGEAQPRLRFSGFNGQWQQRQLGEVAEIVGGGTPDSSNADYWDGDIDWYIPSEIGESRIAQASTRKITREGLNHSSARLLPAGSILFTSRASIGLMAFISHPSATNQGFQSLIPNGEVDPDFLYALGPRISRYAKKHAAGSTFIEISGSSLAKAPLRIPKLPEQRLIGQFFSTFDKIISAVEQQIESLQMAKAAYLQRMFV